MTPREFAQWAAFYQLYPFDDLHRYHRPAAMVAASWGGEYEKKLQFLMPEPMPQGYSRADMNTLKAFGLKPRTK